MQRKKVVERVSKEFDYDDDPKNDPFFELIKEMNKDKLTAKDFIELNKKIQFKPNIDRELKPIGER